MALGWHMMDLLHICVLHVFLALVGSGTVIKIGVLLDDRFEQHISTEWLEHMTFATTDVVAVNSIFDVDVKLQWLNDSLTNAADVDVLISMTSCRAKRLLSSLADSHQTPHLSISTQTCGNLREMVNHTIQLTPPTHPAPLVLKEVAHAAKWSQIAIIYDT